MANSIRGLAAEHGWIAVIRVILWHIFWKDEGKYITISWLVLVAVTSAVYVLVSPQAALLTVGAGFMGLLFSMHSYWTYERLLDNPDFTYNPILGALAVTAIMYLICLVIVVVLFAFWILVAGYTGYPIAFPGAFLTWLAFTVYFFYYRRR